MTLPLSGPLSLNDINLELGRTSGTSIALNDAEDGTYATINVYSCKKPDSANPARVSEWYGYDHNALQAKNRNIFARLQANLSTQNWSIYYNINSGGWTALATSIGATATTCAQRGTAITVNDGDSVEFSVRNSSTGVSASFFGSSGTSSSCPTTGTAYQEGVTAFTVTFDACTLFVGITARVSAGALVVI